MNNKNLVYKFYNENSKLLYVGITNDIGKRINKHKCDKKWFDEVDKIMVSKYMSRNECHLYEIMYIANDNPKYNKDYSNGGSVSLELSKIDFHQYHYKKKEQEQEYFYFQSLTSFDKTEVGESLETVYMDINNVSMFKTIYCYLYELLTINNCIEDFVRMFANLVQYVEVSENKFIVNKKYTWNFNKKNIKALEIFYKIGFVENRDAYYLFNNDFISSSAIYRLNKTASNILKECGMDLIEIEYRHCFSKVSYAHENKLAFENLEDYRNKINSYRN